jgi:GTPase SAR1 family protein
MENQKKEESFYQIGCKQIAIEKITDFEHKYSNCFVKTNSYAKMISIYLDGAKHLFNLDSEQLLTLYETNENEKRDFWENYSNSFKDLIEYLKSLKVKIKNTKDISQIDKILGEVDHEFNSKISRCELYLKNKSPLALKDYLKKMPCKENAKQLLDEYNSKLKEQITISIIGRRGVGKSSFINAFRNIDSFDENAALTDEIECTMTGKFYQFDNYNSNIGSNLEAKIYLLDLPGVGTENFPSDDYVEILSKTNSDIFIYLFKYNLDELDLEMINDLKFKLKKKIPIFLVKNKIDKDFEAYIRSYIKNQKLDDLDDQQIEIVVKDHWTSFRNELISLFFSLNINNNNNFIQEILKEKIYFVSSITCYSKFFDFEILLNDILSNLMTKKSSKIIEKIKSYFTNFKFNFQFF